MRIQDVLWYVLCCSVVVGNSSHQTLRRRGSENNNKQLSLLSLSNVLDGSSSPVQQSFALVDEQEQIRLLATTVNENLSFESILCDHSLISFSFPLNMFSTLSQHLLVAVPQGGTVVTVVRPPVLNWAGHMRSPWMVAGTYTLRTLAILGFDWSTVQVSSQPLQARGHLGVLVMVERRSVLQLAKFPGSPWIATGNSPFTISI